MRKIFIIFLLLLQGSIFSQVDEIIEDLQSNETYKNLGAIVEIMDRNISEMYPYLKDLYDSKPIFVQTAFLEALNQFSDPDIKYKTNILMKRLDNLTPEELRFIDDPLSEKVKLTEILVSNGQYNTINYVFNLINRDGVENINPTAYNLLESILYKIPEYERQAKNILMGIVINNSDQDKRGITLGILSRKYGIEMIGLLRDRFINDPSFPVRFIALKYLILLDRENLHDFLVSKIQANSDWTFELEMIDTLLSIYGKPSDLKLLKDYSKTESNANSKEIISFRINSFIPLKLNLGAKVMVDSLITYTKQLYGFNWIKDSTNYKSYLIELENQKKLIIEEDHGNTIESIDDFLEMVEEHHNAKLLTEEGYKYLYYYETYIKENVEKEL